MSQSKKMVFHGSYKKGVKFLLPHSFSGSNGSQDGIGINLTDALPLAVDYAGGDGSVYVSLIDTSNYLEINRDNYLTDQQAETLGNFFNTKIPNEIKVRLATEFSGRTEKIFSYENESEALSFYKLAKKSHQELPDRLKPHVEFEKEHISVLTPHENISLKGVNTKKIHYLLNLVDNGLASECLSLISNGLAIKKERGFTNYLSFDASLATSLEIPSKGFNIEENLRFINSLKRLDSQDFFDLIDSTKKEDEYFIDPAMAYEVIYSEYNPEESHTQTTPKHDNSPSVQRPKNR